MNLSEYLLRDPSVSERVAGKAREAGVSVDTAMQRNAACDPRSHAKSARGIRIGSKYGRLRLVVRTIYSTKHSQTV